MKKEDLTVLVELTREQWECVIACLGNELDSNRRAGLTLVCEKILPVRNAVIKQVVESGSA